jgi:hypothetical protein
MPDDEAPRASGLVLASRIVLVLAMVALVLEFLGIHRGTAAKIGFAAAHMALLAACVGAALITWSARRPRDSEAAAFARTVGAVALVVAGLLIVPVGIGLLAVI